MIKQDGKLLSQRVFDQLESAIIRRELPPGSHLVEDDIAKELGVSRTPVREAFGMLNRAGWLELHPHVGAYVRHPQLDEVRDVFELRETLEQRATELAVDRITPNELKQLDKVLQRGWKAVESADSDRISALNFSFHGIIARGAGNKLLIRILEDLEKQVRWHFSAVALARREDSWKEHEAILAAIKERDPKEAGRLIVEHNRRTREAYITSLVSGS